MQVLQSLGADARFEGKNDLTIGGKKIAGNAAHIHKHKILHHGCLLFASEIRDVSEALRINPVKYTDKAVKSIPKRVTNISEHLSTPVSLEEFTQKLMAHVLATHPKARLYSFTEEDKKQIRLLRDQKYATHEWNFGKSPRYNYQKAVRTAGGLLEMNLEVKNGIIEGARIYGDFFSERGVAAVENALVHTPHEERALRSTLSQLPLEKHFRHIGLEELLAALF